MGAVYVSSTWKDLRAERKAVRDAVEHLELGHYPLGMETYNAGEETVLEKCAGDAEHASAYILIVGWRYGWRPDPGGPSITEIEWTAAKRAGGKVLVYLQEDDTEPPEDRDSDDRKAVRDFRARLSAQTEGMPGRFRTPAELREKVLIALPRMLGPAKPFPVELRITCDRQDHVAGIAASSGDPAANGPIVALAYGGPRQGALLLAQRLAKLQLLKLCRGGRSPLNIKEPLLLDWSMSSRPESFVERMHGALWQAFPEDGTQPWSAADLSEQRLSFVVAVEVPSQPWEPTTTERLERYASSWRRPPFDAIEGPVIIMLHALSAEPPVSEAFRSVAAKLGSLGRVVLLEELHGVTSSHARKWINMPTFKSFCGDKAPTEAVDALFQGRPTWEMEPLVDKMESIACNFAESRGRK